MVVPFTGLRSTATFPVTCKSNADFSSLSSNGGRVQCMQVWPPSRKKKFETLSYLRPLNRELLAKDIEYLLRMGWIPCLELELKNGLVYHENHKSPGYCDCRYWDVPKLFKF